MIMTSNLVLMHDTRLVPSNLSTYFPVDYEFFDFSKTYSTNTVFVYDHYLSEIAVKQHLESHLQAGYRVIYDNKSEHWFTTDQWWIVELLQKYPQQHLLFSLGSAAGSVPGLRVQAVPAWIWLRFRYHWEKLNYHNIAYTTTAQYKTLCMINQPRRWRDRVWDALDQFGENVLRSYLSRGIRMPDDITSDGYLWEVNPQWFQVTAMSLVCESSIGAIENELSVTAPSGVFISEKSLKPMAMQHPFILIATPGTLAEIRSFGFETFPELWDESYDSVANFQQRLLLIMRQVRQFDVTQLNTPVIQQKLQHNQHRIFDPVVTQQLLQQQVLDPILEFLNE
jgi:hypothetical protein